MFVCPTGELPEAQRYLAEGMHRQPDSALGHFLQGTLDIRLGKLVDAEASLRQAIQLDPMMAQARLQLVNLLLQQGRKEDAVAQFTSTSWVRFRRAHFPQRKDLLKRLQVPQPARIQSPSNSHCFFLGETAEFPPATGTLPGILLVGRDWTLCSPSYAYPRFKCASASWGIDLKSFAVALNGVLLAAGAAVGKYPKIK